MANDNFKSLRDLITDIKDGNYDNIKAALDNDCTESSQDSGSKTVSNAISLTNKGKKPVVNLKNEDKKTPLHIALEQANLNLETIELLLTPELNVNYRYNGPFDTTKQIVKNDNYLHIAARAGNVYAFLLIFKKSIETDTPLLEYNEDHENPLHIAAKMGILKVVVREMLSYLESTANDEIKKLEGHIKKAREDGSNEDVKANQKKIKEIKGKLESDKNYIKNALNSKYALSKDRRTPLDLVSKEVRNQIKETAGIKDRWIDNKNLRLLLFAVTAIVFITALCMSLFLLFQCAESLALATVASICVTGIVSTGTVLVSEICKEDGPYTGVNNSEVTSYGGDSLSLSA